MLVAFAWTGGTPVNSSAGNEMKLPPPATAFSVPPITAVTNRKMAWLKCKLKMYHGELCPVLVFVRPVRRHGIDVQLFDCLSHFLT